MAFMNGVQKRDYARAGVNVMFGFFANWAHSASHFSQLKVIDPPTIMMYAFPIGIGTISGHGWSGTVSDVKHVDTCGHAPVENESCCRDCGVIMQMLHTNCTFLYVLLNNE